MAVALACRGETRQQRAGLLLQNPCQCVGELAPPGVASLLIKPCQIIENDYIHPASPALPMARHRPGCRRCPQPAQAPGQGDRRYS